jgi:hypothetical protein
MVEGHVTDLAGIETIRRFLVAQYRLPKQPTICPLHKEEVSIRDDGSKIVMNGCCREAVNRRLDQISRSVDWLDFYQALSTFK